MRRRAPLARTGLNRKLISFAVASCFAAEFAHANPTGPTVAAGSASFNTVGSTLSVTNTPNAIINWRGFSIGAGEITRFQQQSASSAVLNRVVGQDPSAILGTLWSNGKVFLVNPNGILFGQGSRIDVGGLVASTLNINDRDFLAGKLNFQAGAVANSIVNQGEIRSASGGNIYLVAPDVTNSGLISSPKGEVILAAGKSVSLVDIQTPNLKVEVAASEGEARNLGQIVADSGRIGVYAGLINQQGTVRADTVEVGKAGEIIFRASKDVTLTTGSITSASGASGGVHDGGTARVMSEGTIDMQAGSTLRAEGAVAGGNGGLLELSGKGRMQLAGSYSTRAFAPGFRAGTIVLDPENVDILTGICIVDLCLDPLVSLSGAANVIVTATGDLRVMSPIATANLDPGATLQLDASNNLTVSAAIGTSIARFDHDVTLRAGNNVVVNNNIYLASRTLTLAANVNALDATRTILLTPSPGNTAAGDVIIAPTPINVPVFVDTLGTLNATGVNFTVQGGGSFNAAGGAVDRSVTVNANAMNVNVTGNITIAGGDYVTASAMGPGTTNSAATSDATLSAATSISLTAGGSITIRGGNGSSESPAAIANGGNNTATVNANALVSGGGSVTLTAGSTSFPNTLRIAGGDSQGAHALAAGANTAVANANATVRSTGGSVSLSAPGGNLMIAGGANATAVAGLDAVGPGTLTGNNSATTHADALVSAQTSLTISNTSSVTIQGGNSAQASAWKWAPAGGAAISGALTADASANAALQSGTSLSITLTPGTLNVNANKAKALASESAGFSVVNSTATGTNTATANSNISLTGGTGLAINVGSGNVNISMNNATASAAKILAGASNNALSGTNTATANSKILVKATTGNLTVDAASLSFNNSGNGATAKAYLSANGTQHNLGGANSATADTTVVMDATAGNMTLTVGTGGMTVNGNSASANAYHSVFGSNHIATTSNTAIANGNITLNAAGSLTVGYPASNSGSININAGRGSADAYKTVSGNNNQVSGTNNLTLTSNIKLQAGSGGLTVRGSSINMSGGTETSPRAFHDVFGAGNTVGGNNSATSSVRIDLTTTGPLTLAADAGNLDIRGGSAHAQAYKTVNGSTPGNTVSGTNAANADPSITITAGGNLTVSATNSVSVSAGSARASASHNAGGTGHIISGGHTASANSSITLSSTGGLVQITGTSLTVNARSTHASAARFLSSATGIDITGDNSATADAGVSILGSSGLTINVGSGAMTLVGSSARAKATKTISGTSGNTVGGNETATASSKINIGASAGNTTITVGSLTVSGSSAKASAFKMANSPSTANTLSGNHTANADSTITLSASGTLNIAASGASGITLGAGGFAGATANASDAPNGNTILGANSADAKANAKLVAADVVAGITNTAANFSLTDGVTVTFGAGAVAASSAELAGSNSVSVTGDNMTIAGSINAGTTGIVTLAPFTPSRNIHLEFSPTGGVLSFSPADLARLDGGTVQIGSSAGTGILNVFVPLANSDFGPNVGTFRLRSGDVYWNAGNDLASSGSPFTRHLDIVANNNVEIATSNLYLAPGKNLTILGGTLTPGHIYIGTFASPGGAIFAGGDVLIDGQGKASVMMDASTISGGTGNVSISGHGAPGATDFAMGVQLANGAAIQTTSGAITINGTGGTGGLGVSNHGIGIGNSTIGTTGGDIALTGQGGSTVGQNGSSQEGSHHGIFLFGPATISTTGSGKITLNGTGGTSSTFGGNMGVRIVGDQSAPGLRGVVTTVNGDIGINGQGGNSTDPASNTNRGVSIFESTVRSTGTGNINITGVGGTSGSGQNQGVVLNGDATVSGGFISTNSGNLTIDGTGGSQVTGDVDNVGLLIVGKVSVGTTTGNMTLKGTTTTASNAAIGIGPDEFNPATGGPIDVNSGGTLDITANGSLYLLAGGATNHHVQVTSLGNQTVTAGPMYLVGGSGTDNFVRLGANAGTQTINATSLELTGGEGTNNFTQINKSGNGAQTVTVTGAITMTAGGITSSGSTNNAQIQRNGAGLQHVTADSIRLEAGGGATGLHNQASIFTFSGSTASQQVDILGPAGLTMIGGTGSAGENKAGFWLLADQTTNSGTVATQTVNVSGGGSITITGGSNALNSPSGFNNNAGIYAAATGAGSSQTVNVAGAGGISLTGGASGISDHANIWSLTPTQTITTGSGGISLQGDGGATGINDRAYIFQEHTAGSQSITVNGGGSILTTGGTGSGGQNFGQILNNGSGLQSITFTAPGGTIVVHGGTGNIVAPATSGNGAFIDAAVGNQTIGGNSLANNPSITLIGGDSGGNTGGSASSSLGNNVLIRALLGTQHISAGSILVNAGLAGVDNSATIQALSQTITASSVTLGGGGTSGTFGGARIGGIGGVAPGPTNLSLTTTGDVTVAGGSVSGASIGANAAGGMATAITINSGGSVVLNPGTGASARIGSPAANMAGGDISITAGNAIALNSAPGLGTAIRTLGNVTLNAPSITQGPDSVIVSGGTTTIGGGTVSLPSATNQFGTVLLNTTGNVTITDADAINFGTSTTGSGSLTVTAPGGITQSGPITTGAATFDAGASPIVLTNAGNDFTGPVDIGTTSSAQITDANAFIIQGGGGGGGGGNPTSLTINANGAVTQSAAFTGSAPAVVVINAGSGPITLNNTGNSFTGNTSVTANTTGAVSFTNGNAAGINLGASTVGGALSLTSGGPVTQSGPVAVSGASTINAGSNAITLTNASNDFGGAVNFTGSNVSLTDVNAISIGNSNASGTLNIVATSTSFLNGFSANNYSFSGGTYVLATGTYNLGGTTTVASGATVTASGATINGAGGTMDVVGTFNASSGTVTTGTINVTGSFNASGATLNTGTANVSGSFNTAGGTLNIGTLNVGAGGTLSGTGTIQGNVNNVAGTVTPGASPGILTITGNYTQGASGTLGMEIGGLIAGTQYDQLVVGGSTSLAGTLNTALVNGFVPVSGNTFTLIQSTGPVTGTFTTVNQPVGALFNSFYGPTTFEFISAASATLPPPLVTAVNNTIATTTQLNQPVIEVLDKIVVTYVVPSTTTTPEGKIVPKPPACN